MPKSIDISGKCVRNLEVLQILSRRERLKTYGRNGWYLLKQNLKVAKFYRGFYGCGQGCAPNADTRVSRLCGVIFSLISDKSLLPVLIYVKEF